MRNMKIMIVDFDEDSSNALSEYLNSEGFDVCIAGDGELGLEKCKAELPDLVIVEPMISKLHGFELCSIISHDFNGQIPVVILTKFYREEQFKIEAMSAYGASAFLTKPFKGPEILSTINDLLKEKIKESEDFEMAEETHDLEDFSEQALDNIEVGMEITEQKLKEDLENEILEPLPLAGKISEKKEKGPDIKTQIDKMLEDTLSEFGINLGKTTPPRREEKREAPPEENIKPAAKETAVTEIHLAESRHTNKAVEEEKVVIEEKIKTAEEQAEKVSIPAREKENTIFSAMEEEKKPKISPLSALRNPIQRLKKLPLKFIISLILIAAIALSASFIFRKPKSKEITPQNLTAAVQPLDQSESDEPEEILLENPNGDIQSHVASPAQTPTKQPLVDRPAEEGTEVKTKVNEVFAAVDPLSQEQDVESVNLAKDVLMEPVESAPSLLLAQELPGSSLESDQAPVGTRSDNPIEESDPPENPDIIPEEQPQEGSQTGDDNPPVEEGDLIPLEDVDIEPEIAKRVDPKYPSLAFERGVEGKVMINVLISESGDVIEAALIRGIVGPYGFNKDCTEAARQWKFVPAFKNGVKVKVWKTLSFTFKKS